MPIVSGRLVFDRNRSNTIDAGDSGLANVEIVLQNTTSNLRLVVLTDASGNYSFINVGNGSYRIVESFGIGGGVATPGDFNNAVLGSVPVGVDPPIGFATSPPAGSTNLDSITPNTLFITVSGADVTNQNFLDGPVIYTPITSILDPCAVVSSINFITAADSGIFGTFPQGTAANTGVITNPPYPGVTPDFTYVMPSTTIVRPDDGEYTVQNIMNDALLNTQFVPGGFWWRVTAHSYPDETGRYMVINGANPGAVFFQQTVAVTPNTDYLFSSWIINMFKIAGFSDPALGVQILDQNNNILYQQTLGALIPANTAVPEWKQIGTAINTVNNNQITVRFTSQGPAAQGNDYAIDDVALQQINFPTFSPVKSVSPKYADTNQIVTYTVTLANTCSNTLSNVFFQDTIPAGLSFIAQSATGGTNPLTDNPVTGFSVPNIGGNSIATITFQVQATTIPSSNPLNNNATMRYSYSPVQGGILADFNQQSNTIPLQINQAQIISNKGVNKTYATCGEIITYTITVPNAGNVTATNVVFKDTIPSGTSLIDGSVIINGVTQPNGTNPQTGLNLGSINPGGLSTVSFRVNVIC